ncbi:hypothetical protein ACJMK2_037012, partial [Sinanodonta woodiana]
MAIDRDRHYLCLLVLLFLATATSWCNGEKMIFKTGFEYQYTFDSTAELVNVGKFLIKAKLGFTNIQDLEDGQEILMKVYQFTFAPEQDPSIIGHNLDVSNWFSFVMTHRGEILRVYHPSNEDNEALSVKKGFAGLLSSKIYTEEETLHFQNNLETIHSVMVKEELLIPGALKSGFDPYFAMRPVKAVNEFEKDEFPEIRAITNGELRFLTRISVDNSPMKPQKDLTIGTIQISIKVKKATLEKNLTQVLEHVKGNLSCIVKQPKGGSPEFIHCSMHLQKALGNLPTSELEKLADYYFRPQGKQFSSYTAQAEQDAMLDALGSLQTNESQMILYKYIFDSDKVDERLVQRLLVHISVMDELPNQVLINGVKQICETRCLGKQPLSTEAYHRTILSLGSVAKKLDKHGQKDQAKEITQYLQNMLGLHDPWVYRQKRSSMTEEESIEYDTFKVTLVGALGNARHDDSYHYIISHMNDTNSPWIKRAAVFALRHYQHQKAADALLTAALTDEDENVRYEALLQYQNHPLSRIIMPLYTRFDGNGRYITDPYESGVIDIQSHPMSKRGILDEGLKFRLEAPSVDWQKRIGTSDIGASFGLIMVNLFDLKIALSSGHIKVNVHDEAYARMHLGINNMNYNFFTARLCFKGGASYKLNILKDFDPKFGFNIVKQFIEQIQKIVNTIKVGVDTFTALINGDLSIQRIVEEFITALKNIPGRVLSLGSRINQVLMRLQQIRIEKLPSFVQPLQNLVKYITGFIDNIQMDVMTFYNRIIETVTIIIPQSAAQIFQSQQDILKSFAGILRDPQTALGDIGAAVINIALSIKRLLNAKDKLEEVIPKKDPVQYWMNISSVIDEVSEKTNIALQALENFGESWIKQQLNPGDDLIKKFTDGNYSEEDLRRQIIAELKSITNDILQPFNDVQDLGGEFLNQFFKLFNLVKDIKEAWSLLKNGYEEARTRVDKIFGPKCHKDFPRDIRVSGGGCSEDGTFPGLDKYEHGGVDVEIAEGRDVVAPFSGVAILSDKADEIKIINSSDLALGSVIVLTNVAPDDRIQNQNDASYTKFYVGKGDKIGTATKSPCTGMNHIHLAVLRDGGAVDPTNFLESKLVEAPKWVQQCDDMKLMLKNEVLVDRALIGIGGKKSEDKTPDIPASVEKPEEVDENKRPGQDLDGYKSDDNSMYSRVKSSLSEYSRKKKSTSALFDTSDNGSNSFGSTIQNFLKQTVAFLERFSIRRLKMGEIIFMLDFLQMTESRDKLAVIFKKIKVLVDTKPCMNPYIMPDEDLQVELMNRGLDTGGSREQQIERLVSISHSCPLISLSMPESEMMYCSLDEQCLGLECCITINVFDLLQMTVHAFVRYDPCANQIHMGFSDWEKTFDVLQEGFEDTIIIGSQLSFLGGLQLLIKYQIQKTEAEVVATVGAGVCKNGNTKDCPVFFNLLEDAVLPIPVCNSDGSITWPKVDWSTYFNKEAVLKRLQESAKKTQEKLQEEVLAGVLKALGLPEDLLAKTPPCPRPETLTMGVLLHELTLRNLSTDGTKEELIQRLKKDDLSCEHNGKILSLQEITSSSLNKLLYYKIARDCMKLYVCLDITLPEWNFTKALSASLELDPCNYIFKAAFESFSKTFVLIDYEWGIEKTVDISSNWKVRFSIDKDNDKKVFDIDLGLKSQYIDKMFLQNIEIPMPVCSADFSIRGMKNWTSLAAALGGELTNEAFNLLLKQAGLDVILYDRSCIAQTASHECLGVLNITDILSSSLSNVARCKLTDSCNGLQCCWGLNFTIPLSSKMVHFDIPFGFKLDACKFMFEAWIGSYHHTEKLLQYDWGKLGVLKIGKGNPAPVEISYMVDQYPDGFIVDVVITLCIPVDGKAFCYPKEGLHVLNKARLPACNQKQITSIMNFSLTEWFAEQNFSLDRQLGEAGLKLLLMQLGLDKYLCKPSCDRKRTPYTPSVSGWNNLCPLSFVNLPSLPHNYLTCHIPDNCTSIDCCVDVKQLGLSFNIKLDVNSCNYYVAGYIETFGFNFSLFDYEWGKTEVKTILGIFKLTYTIKKPPKEKIFIIDLGIRACFEKDQSCIVDIMVMKGTEVPQPLCDMSAVLGSDFYGWLGNHGLAGLIPSDKQWGEAINLFSKLLGLDKYYNDPPCSKHERLYAPVQRGFKNECPVVSNLPETPQSVVCNLPNYCTGLDCCVELEWLKRSVHLYFHIDTCQYIVKGGIDKFTFEENILDYKWGTVREIELLHILKIRFMLERLDGEKKLIADLDFSLCMEGSGPCQFDLPILKQTTLPQPLCDMNMNFSMNDFSLTNWMKTKNVDVGKALTSSLIAYLLRDLGLEDLLLKHPCERIKAPYSPSQNGWNKACPANIELPILRNDISCYIPDYCTGVDCCTYVDLVRRSFRTYFLLNACNFFIEAGLERLSFKIMLLNYTWGKIEHLTLRNVIRISYSVFDLASEKKYLLSLNLSICFEADTCLVSEPVLKNVKLPKVLCDWNSGFLIPDFSLEGWLKENGYELGRSLMGLTASKLMEGLGLSRYLQDVPCNRSSHIYSPNIHGWNKECPSTVDFSPLPSTLTCHIPNYCTGVDCCVDVGLIGKSFHVYVFLDTCNYTLTVGIEKSMVTKSLISYKYGTVENFSLLGVMKIRFSILDLKTNKQLVLNLDMSICFESHGPCVFTQTIFRDTKIPKPGCDWSGKNEIIDLTWSKFKEGLNIDISGVIAGPVVDAFLEKLGIASFLKEQRCLRQGASYSSSSKGWSSACPAVLSKLPTLPDSISCHVPDYCTGIDCCVEIKSIQRNFNLYLLLDACNYQLTVGIEKFMLNRTLFNYKWGTVEHMTLKNIFRIDFAVEDLPTMKKYSVSLNISVCFQSSCDIRVLVVNQMEFPKPLCNWEGNFNLPEFSLDTWLENAGIQAGEKLTELLVSHLFENLGISPYLRSPECQKSSSPFSPAVQGWNKECRSEFSLPALPDYIGCHISADCQKVDCCVEVQRIRRSFNVHLHMDTCNLRFSIGIEKLQANVSLIHYEWGKVKHIALMGFVRLSYNISDLQAEHMYQITLNMSICFTNGDHCVIQKTLLKESKITKPTCNWERGFALPDFSLSQFMLDHKADGVKLLSGLLLAKLYETLGIGEYLEEKPCHRSQSPYSSAVNGWSKACPLNVPTSTLPDTVTCHIPDYCTGMECCMNVEIMGRGLHAYILMDSCNYRLVVGIENMKINISLRDYQFGEEDHFYLLGVVHLDYKIEEKRTENFFIVSVNLSLCLESGQGCRLVFPIFAKTILPKPLCNWESGFSIPDFSLESWLHQNGFEITGQLQAAAVDILLEQLGISHYLLKQPCIRNSYPFIPQQHGWNDECKTKSNLTALPEVISCHRSDLCTEITCCADVELIGRSISVSIMLDACKYRLSLKIEQFIVEVHFRDYEKYLYFGSFILSEALDSTAFEMSLNMSVCFESDANKCVLRVPIITNAILLKPFCTWGTGFILPDFSLGKWIADNKITSLTETVVSSLLDYLGISKFLGDINCHIDTSRYTQENGGWKNDCPSLSRGTFLPALPGRSSCYIPDYCTGIECCLDVPLIKRSIHVYVEFDVCKYKMKLGIENFNTDMMLLNFDWGLKKTLQLQGIFQIEFTAYDINAENKLLIDLEFKACFNTDRDCDLIVPVFKKLEISKSVCSWNVGFIKEDFSLTNWLKDLGLNSTDDMTQVFADRLLHKLGLSDYLIGEQCRINTKSISSSECTSTLSIPHLPDLFTCHMVENCSKLECCVNVTSIRKSFRFHILLDTWNYQLSLGVENFMRNISFLNFDWGSVQEFSFFGLLKIRYQIDDLKGAGMFLLNLNLSICFSANQNCDYNFILFNNAKWAKTQWSLEAGFMDPDFSLKEWLKFKQLDMQSKLDKFDTTILLDKLGILKFLQKNQCDRSSLVYSPSVRGWKNECPSKRFLPDLPSESVSCYVPNYCTEVRCCLYVGFLGKSFEISFKFDERNYLIHTQIENFKKTILFSNFQWGLPHIFDIFGVLRIKFTVDNVKSRAIYLVDLEASLCLDKTDCILDFSIFKQLQLPQISQDWNKKFKLLDFSLTRWKQDNGISNGLLNGFLTNRLLEELGIAEYLFQPSCNRNRIPYTPSIGGWNTECPLLTSLPHLPDTVSCHITDQCLNLTCCIDVPVIGWSFNLALEIDLCSYRLIAQIEKMTRHMMLINYTWGQVETVSLYGPVKLEYSLYDLTGEKSILLTLSVLICTEAGQSCDTRLTLLDQEKLPKPFCSWNNTSLLSVISLDGWLVKRGFTLEALTEQGALLLLEYLGVAQYLKQPACAIQDKGTFKKLGQWTNSCPAILKLPDLPGKVACNLFNTCTSLECCVQVPFIKRNVQFMVLIDTCQLRLTLGIENLSVNISLLDYQWGQIMTFSILDIYQIQYRISDLKSEQMFEVDLNFSMCIEAGDNCQMKVPVLSHSRLPKLICNLKLGYTLPDFSLSKWLQGQGLSNLTILTDSMKSLLMEQLGVAMYLREQQCNRMEPPFNSPNMDWNKACSLDIYLPALPDNLSCHIGESCTSVDCCLDIPLISQAIEFKVHVDICAFTMVVGIENYSHNISLFNYEFGKEEHIWLMGLFRIDFTIYDLSSKNVYLVNLDISVCWDANRNKDCDVHISVFRNTLLPKIPCNPTPGYNIPDFSLDQWLQRQGLAAHEILTGQNLNKLMDDLGLTKFLITEQCSGKQSPYIPSTHGWRIDCPQDLILPQLASDVACYIPDYCTKVDCCVQLDRLNRSFHVYVHIDTCHYQLTLSLEKLSFNHSLLEYQWGTDQHVWLFGLIRMRFRVNDLSMENNYLVNLNISICPEANGNCALMFNVLNDTKLPKINCNWERSFEIPDFSLQSWYKQNGLGLSQQLDSYMVSRLLEETGIAEYMRSVQCTHNAPPFLGGSDGWNKECPFDLQLVPLHNGLSCHIPTSCTGVDCCVDVDLIGRSIRTFVLIDPCDNKMAIGIEKLVANHSLSDYRFGQVEHFWLKGIFRIDFKIFDLKTEGMYLVNLNISVCFEARNSCNVGFPIMTNTKLTKRQCQLNEGFAIAACPRLSSNIILPDMVYCHVSDTCTSLDCCVDVELLSHSFHLYLYIDTCNQRVTVGIERLKFDLMMVDYIWGTVQEVFLKGIVRIRFSMDDLAGEKVYLLNLNISVCLDGKAPCVINTPVFENTRLPKPICDWNSNFTIPGFSLIEWIVKNDYPIGQRLTSLAQEKLVEALGLAPYLLQKPCNYTVGPFSSAVDGWNKDCVIDQQPASLPEFMVCHIPRSCTGVECCTFVHTVDRTFRTFLHLDPCTYRLSIGIEELQFNISLLNYDWGEKKTFYLAGVVRM